MLQLEHLDVRAGAFALHDISLEVPLGDYAILMGNTGSGKTTLLEAICGLRPVAAGTVRVADQDIDGLPPRARGIGYLPQDLALFSTMNVREHLGFALAIRRTPESQIVRRVTELANLLGLTALLERMPAHLSGGEKQRVALGRALAARPSVLLLDEPFSALDDQTRETMYALMQTVQKATGATVLHVTHSHHEACALGDHVFMLSAGRITRLD